MRILPITVRWRALALLASAWLSRAGIAGEIPPSVPRADHASRAPLVPTGLAHWKTTFSVGSTVSSRKEFTKPDIEISSTGDVVIRNSLHSPVEDHIDHDEREGLIEMLTEASNRFYLCDSRSRRPSPEGENSYGVRLTAGSRSVEFGFEQSEPSRMGLEPLLLSVLDVSNRQLRRHNFQDAFPEPFRLDRDYRDPVRAPNDGIVPTQLSHWRVKIGFDSKQQRVEIFAESSIRGPNLDQLRIFVNQQKDELTKIQPRHTAVLFESARTIVNGFSLVAEEDEGGASPVQKLRIEVGNDFRQIGVECNEMRTMPMAWRECLLEVIAAVNEAIEPGHEKIRPIPDAE